MKNTFVYKIFCLFSLIVTSCSYGQEPINDDNYHIHKIKNGTVKITSEMENSEDSKDIVSCRRFGTGFFVNNNGLIVTSSAIIEDAQSVRVQVLNEREFEAKIIDISSNLGLGLLQLSSEGIDFLKNILGYLPDVTFGNSDSLHKGDNVLSIGCFQHQKSSAIICNFIGYEDGYLTICGNIPSINGGGPLFDRNGDIIGILSLGIVETGVFYCIPSVNITIALENFHKQGLLHQVLGFFYDIPSDDLRQKGNSLPGGCHIVKVLEGGVLDRMGVQKGDTMYEINGNQIDKYGEVTIPFLLDTIQLSEYVKRLLIGDELRLVIYRNGQRIELRKSSLNTN